MRSTSTPDPPRRAGDRTARARIRDAAIAMVAERGADALSARAVATAAGVSAGLVIHHFGSMEALRTACDEQVVSVIRTRKLAAFTGTGTADVMAALREEGMGHYAAYLAAVLADDSPAVSSLVDEMVTDALAYLERGVASGMLRPSADPRGRAVVLTLWNLGALMMNTHLRRLLGVDLTAPDLGRLASYLGPVQELYGHGLFTPAFAEEMADSLREGAARPPRRTTAELFEGEAE